MSRRPNILSDSFGWDVVNWSRSTTLWAKSLPADLTDLRALEVGCGALNGGLSLWLASMGAKATASSVVNCGADMAKFQRRHELAGSIRFENVDVLSIPDGEPFDIICWKSMLGGIGRDGTLEAQAAALRSITAALKPGGWALYAENLAATRMHMTLRKKWGAARNQWRYFVVEELHRLIAESGLTQLDSDSTGFLGTLGRDEFQKRILGQIDGLLCPFLPRSWHYIAYGAARKPTDSES
jgi:SAM-dependent methyltransferase